MTSLTYTRNSRSRALAGRFWLTFALVRWLQKVTAMAQIVNAIWR